MRETLSDCEWLALASVTIGAAPAVPRDAWRRLLDRGLLARAGDGWVVTEAGHAAIREADAPPPSGNVIPGPWIAFR
jgi:hypothetical protein